MTVTFQAGIGDSIASAVIGVLRRRSAKSCDGTSVTQSLASTNDAVARVAERVGYESEAAFNRAFKREFGIPPAAWRRTVRATRNRSHADPGE